MVAKVCIFLQYISKHSMFMRWTRNNDQTEKLKHRCTVPRSVGSLLMEDTAPFRLLKPKRQIFHGFWDSRRYQGCYGITMSPGLTSCRNNCWGDADELKQTLLWELSRYQGEWQRHFAAAVIMQFHDPVPTVQIRKDIMSLQYLQAAGPQYNQNTISTQTSLES